MNLESILEVVKVIGFIRHGDSSVVSCTPFADQESKETRKDAGMVAGGEGPGVWPGTLASTRHPLRWQQTSFLVKLARWQELNRP